MCLPPWNIQAIELGIDARLVLREVRGCDELTPPSGLPNRPVAGCDVGGTGLIDIGLQKQSNLRKAHVMAEDVFVHRTRVKGPRHARPLLLSCAK